MSLFHIVLHHEFQWDEVKHQANVQKHGFSFLAAKEIFQGDVLQKRSDRLGENRWIAIGCYQTFIVTVVYTLRADEIRIISIRRARDDEQRAYRALYQ